MAIFSGLVLQAAIKKSLLPGRTSWFLEMITVSPEGSLAIIQIHNFLPLGDWSAPRGSAFPVFQDDFRFTSGVLLASGQRGILTRTL